MQVEAQLEIGLYCCNQAVNLYGGIARHCREGRNKQMGACAVSRPSSAVKNRTSIPSPDEPSLFAKSRPAPASLSRLKQHEAKLVMLWRIAWRHSDPQPPSDTVRISRKLANSPPMKPQTTPCVFTESRLRNAGSCLGRNLQSRLWTGLASSETPRLSAAKPAQAWPASVGRVQQDRGRFEQELMILVSCHAQALH